MPDRESGAVKVVLAVGAVLITLMIVGFAGAFMLMKYQHDQAAQAEEQARMEQEKRERSDSLGVIGTAIGEHLGKKFADKLAEEDVETLKKAAANLGESLGKKIGESEDVEQLKDALKAATESMSKELVSQSSESDSKDPTSD